MEGVCDFRTILRREGALLDFLAGKLPHSTLQKVKYQGERGIIRVEHHLEALN
jgi:hypothetical protein